MALRSGNEQALSEDGEEEYYLDDKTTGESGCGSSDVNTLAKTNQSAGVLRSTLSSGTPQSLRPRSSSLRSTLMGRAATWFGSTGRMKKGKGNKDNALGEQ